MTKKQQTDQATDASFRPRDPTVEPEQDEPATVYNAKRHDPDEPYAAVRQRVIETSLDEGTKLYELECVRRGGSASHFIFRARNEARTRHDVHVVFDPADAVTFWHALICSCKTGRRAGDPCWHKGAVREWMVHNADTRYANRLLGLPLT